ncbi:hypothetical protein [Kutzneria sp. NPDC051319]|uniref:hypothetical protein n=1 Tax=Kutzneria sp. NPDC051319 TaxID=3155047 RepID=UPI0034410FB5
MGFFTVSSKTPTMRAKGRKAVGDVVNRAVATTGGAVCVVCERAIGGARAGKANVHPGACTRALANSFKSIHDA